MGGVVPWMFTLVAAFSGAGMLWMEVQKQKQQQQQQQEQADLKVTKKRKKQHMQLGTLNPSAPAGIPPHELSALRSFLRKVYTWRGWQSGSYHILQAWHAAETAAAGEVGGGWMPDFSGTHLNSKNCDKLLNVIDITFFGGKLLKRMKSQRQQQQQQQQHSSITGSRSSSSSCRDTQCSAVQCKIVQAYGPNDTWLCYFDTDDNVIYINRWRWGKHITPQDPVNCEGVVCTSRLQMLLHTLAHELVHAIVYHLLPEIDRSSPAYLPNDRHGPIFQLLNKQLFGHSSNALEDVQLLPCRH